MKRGVFITLVLAALIGMGVVSAVVVLMWWRWSAVQPRPLNTATVVQRIQGLSQLVTVSYVLEKVVVIEDPQYLGNLIPLGENRIILLAHGEVKAGVDFTTLTPGDVSVSGRKIVLTIPPPIVVDAHLIEQHTKVLDWKTGLFRSFDKELEEKARRHALAEIQRAARQGGIVDEATRRARQQLTGFLQALGFEEVEVRVRAK